MKIEKLDNKGRGITFYNEKIMFIENALPEEVVEVSNIRLKKKYYEAEVTEIKNYSKYRVIPKCPYYHECGGCNIMHMSIEEQEEFKLNKVASILKKYADVDTEVKLIKNDRELFYRNKVTLKIQDYKWGYYNSNTHTLKEIDNCLLASNSINEIINKKDLFKIKNGEITIRSNYENKILISIVSDDDIKIDYELLPDNIVGIVVNNNTVYKENYFFDKIDNLLFKVSYNSFFQVNNYIASKIFDVLKNNLSGEYLLDLYCGVGTLGLALKDKYKNIYGIEKIENAIKDAKINANRNSVKNANYFAGDTAKILKRINKNFDTVIVDPPRSGLNEETLNDILKINPKNLCYVSCDPMTLARDLKILKEYYEIKKVNALDMFPNTYHVECVCVLKRK